MSANASDRHPKEQAPSATSALTASTPVVPKRITNAQTVCNEKNEKGKLCNGHLKQLRTAGEAAEVHLRGDDVLSKCQTCGTLYMGPPLGHVRDPDKQRRFVEAELTALLRAAGGTLPVIKKNEKGVYVMVEAGVDHGPAAPALPAAGPLAPASAAGTPEQRQTQPVAPTLAKSAPVAKAPSHNAGAQPNRQLLRRSTYCGVADTGPLPGETFERKVARLKAVAAAAKQRAEEGGGEVSAPAAADASATEIIAPPVAAESARAPAAQETARTAGDSAAPQAVEHKTGDQPNRQLFKRSTYCGVVDIGPVAGETFEQKIERLRALAAAAKQRAEEGGAGH